MEVKVEVKREVKREVKVVVKRGVKMDGGFYLFKISADCAGASTMCPSKVPRPCSSI